ncbi:MAG: bifunctional 3-hydroxydecanoyl-ACP dehydratase/trans-2-decenoyl-ACP isomerase [Syntrophales bacterium]|jgi:3-hydroxyacyl-[acyl-carrier protein] dehydratase/trans-2-decenoyl-[acyl-carrier protein] isomerase|nr:bifunctional 3-hydroxydecanoyl-ACP dehydratase/trans-2-decenoyl-ACP isomerase [Syntrophales bacterium]MDY0045410.1 bifunctional 3-hydroxydecanoyl-ACP dehydratase/trans-2-decenoyl-ACP isomerase [Syntrophales bacterium]
MLYQEFIQKSSFSLEDLIAFSYGYLVADPPEHFDARLPAPPFLMPDRILSISRNGRKGAVVAEQDVQIDGWYFQCHMPGDPVFPGCLCLDAIWQLLGFYCVWRQALGSGRALGCDEVSFNGQIRPYNRIIRYEIEVLRFSNLKDSGASLGIADAKIFIDNEQIMTVKKARTGTFKGIAYHDYPLQSANSRGGKI